MLFVVVDVVVVVEFDDDDDDDDSAAVDVDVDVVVIDVEPLLLLLLEFVRLLMSSLIDVCSSVATRLMLRVTANSNERSCSAKNGGGTNGCCCCCCCCGCSDAYGAPIDDGASCKTTRSSAESNASQSTCNELSGSDGIATGCTPQCRTITRCANRKFLDKPASVTSSRNNR